MTGHGPPADRFAPLQARVVLDALHEATAAYWRRRAATFDAARPRSNDFTGRASPSDLAAGDARCHTIADACRQRALVEDDNYGWFDGGYPMPMCPRERASCWLPDDVQNTGLEVRTRSPRLVS